MLVMLLKKNVDVSVSNSFILEPSSPLYEYITLNHSNIKKNDPILTLFIKNGGTIEGDTRYYKYELPCRVLNNLFHNIIYACKPSTKSAVSLAKTVCFAKSHNIRERLRNFLCCLKYGEKKDRRFCFKLPKPLFNMIVNRTILDDPDMQEIVGALDQKVYSHRDAYKKPLDYFSDFYGYIPHKNMYQVDTNPYPVRDKQEIIIYDPEEWIRNPLKQLMSCNQSKK